MRAAVGDLLDIGDLAATPDDGNRWEILDGAFVVTPAPGSAHQGAVGELFVILHRATRPLGLRVFPAPLAWRISAGQIPEPDLIVATRQTVTARGVEGPPLLVVEVLSPSGRDRDLHDKRRIYAGGRAAWYWLVDLDHPRAAALTVLRLDGDDYSEVAVVAGRDAYVTDEPFPIRVVPADLTS